MRDNEIPLNTIISSEGGFFDMGYAIIPDYFVPKINDKSYPEQLHCIVYDRCNYDCIFCPKQYKNGKSINYTPEEFESKIIELMKKSNGFKFTGGEPTLNPRLLDDISIIKKHGGIVFLDTNGTNPEVVDKITERKMVDVIGISLKGINEKMAKDVTGASITKCWINVNKTLEQLSKTDIDTILTFVVDDSMSIHSIMESLKHYVIENKKLYLKINNYFLNPKGGDLFTPMNEEALVEEVNRYVENHPALKGRVIVIKNKKAVSDGRYIARL